MAEEFAANKYYSQTLNDERRWLDLFRYETMAIEKFFGALLFKNDFSRIIYSTSDIAFRRRIELMDSVKTSEEDFKHTPINLNLPFMSYCQTGEVEPDDRGSTQQASQSLRGQYDPYTGNTLRSTAYKKTFEATCYFARRDEVRLAQQLLYWEQEPRHPVWLIANMRWRNNKLKIPCFLTIDKIETDIGYKESSWLTQSKIFPVKVTMTMRSYQVLISNVEKIYTLPIRFGNMWGPGDDVEDQVYLVEESILVWCNDKFDLDDAPYLGNIHDNPDVNAVVNQYFEKDPYTEQEVKDLIGEIPNYSTNDILRGYLLEVPEIYLDYFYIDENLSTPTSLTLKYKVKDSNINYFNQMRILIPGHEDIVVTDRTQKSVLLDKLENNSEYGIKILARSETGVETLYQLKGITRDSETNMAPQPNKINRRRGNSLIGLQF